MQSQATSTILMIRPVCFGFNEQTAPSNAFQDKLSAVKQKDTVQADALREFDAMVRQLRAAGVEVLVYEDTPNPYTPDSIFPNNWVSFHQSGKVCLYPMQAENRRLERRMDIIDSLRQNFEVDELIDFTDFEKENKFLEGTGSLVLDRTNRIAYACLSPRTHSDVLKAWQNQMQGYKIVSFSASDAHDQAIYHTNVLMCVGDSFAVVCLECLKNIDERLILRQALENSGKHVVEISMQQMNCFAGNMLLVKNQQGHQFLAMSSAAFESLATAQIRELESFANLLHFDLSVIEANGGGSARCMMAEVHLLKR